MLVTALCFILKTHPLAEYTGLLVRQIFKTNIPSNAPSHISRCKKSLVTTSSRIRLDRDRSGAVAPTIADCELAR